MPPGVHTHRSYSYHIHTHFYSILVKFCYLCAAFRRLDLELNPGQRRLIEFFLFNAVSHALLLDCIAQAQNCPKRASIVEGLLFDSGLYCIAMKSYVAMLALGVFFSLQSLL